MSTYFKKSKIKFSLFNFIAFLFIFFYLFTYVNFSKINNDLFYVFNENNFYSICCISSNNKENINSPNLSKLPFNKIIKNANKNFCYMDVESNSFSNKIYKEILTYDYIELKSCNLEGIKKILKKFNAKLVMAEKLEDKNVEYFFLPQLKKYKLCSNLKVNLQIVWQQQECLIGYPMIYTSF